MFPIRAKLLLRLTKKSQMRQPRYHRAQKRLTQSLTVCQLQVRGSAGRRAWRRASARNLTPVARCTALPRVPLAGASVRSRQFHRFLQCPHRLHHTFPSPNPLFHLMHLCLYNHRYPQLLLCLLLSLHLRYHLLPCHKLYPRRPLSHRPRPRRPKKRVPPPVGKCRPL